MSALELGEVRALLRLFGQSDLLDLWVRAPAWSVFLAKPGGGREPGVGTVDDAPAGPATDNVAIDAPHLGILRDPLPLGTTVTAGGRIATLDVLREERAVAAPRDGTIAAVLAEDGALLEYGQPIALLA